MLQTQVFLKGRCIGKRATSYAEQTEQPGFSEEHMHEMLKDQHKHFVAAVREGRIESELGEHSEHAHAEELPPAAAALLAEFAVVNGAAAGSDSQPEEPAAVIVEPEEIEDARSLPDVVEPEKVEAGANCRAENRAAGCRDRRTGSRCRRRWLPHLTRSGWTISPPNLPPP